ncbi:MAG TPA: putative 2OG-Fe(II) oxygenase [Steroidobacteraceae bacterium]|nr:putative 2OG-Fe(II) oxygenase [Steroidobacteraceae bacterium]
MQRFGAAREALEIALQHAPGSRQIRLERAQIMEREGLTRDALAELEALERDAQDSPQLLVQLGRALQFAGRTSDAETKVEAALALWPTDAALHVLLAELRWQRGAGAAATSVVENAIEKFPAELKLRLIAADLLRNSGRSGEALRIVEQGLARAPDSPAFLTSIGVLLDDLDRSQEALPYLRAAVVGARDRSQPMRNLIPALLRIGAAAEALASCDELGAHSPDDQQLIAYRATALRLLGDARYSRLYDYARLVRTYPLRPPAGFADIGAFNEAFARELTSLHHAAQRPLAQSLRGGTQTQRNLPAGNAIVDAFFSMVDAPIRDYIDRLHGADGHPVDRRKATSYRIAGSWSVQLQPGGFHMDHVHPQGWLSSAYYVELPDTAGESRAGWLKFGEPGVRIRECPAEHFIHPQCGLLVLFPSYFWHGTVPFSEGGRRLTAAFDVIPA